MNTILLQKILDILKEGLAHVGDFFKDLFVSDPQDGQVIGYDGETGEWKNMDIAELSFDITHTAGPAASISISDAAAGMPVKSLNVNIVPQQASGIPTPDNPLPISGTDEVVVTHTGKNLFPQASVSGTKSETVNFSLPLGEYTISALVTSSDTDGTKSLILFTYEDGTTENIIIERNTRQSDTITFTKGITRITFYAGYNSSQSSGDTFTYSDIQIEAGTTATAYEPYTATTHTIALPSTVYGGEVDVVSGQGEETHVIVDLGNLSWTRLAISDGYAFVSNSISEMRAVGNITTIDSICSSYPLYMSGNGSVMIDKSYRLGGTYAGVRRISVRDDTYTTVSDFTVAVQGVKVVYPLATPTHFTTTPTTINTQGGTETFIANADTIEMEYYTATAGTIKDLVSITEDITSEITKNTTDFSDILLKVSQNNKVVSVEIYSATTSAAINDTFLSNLPKPAMNCKVLLANTTLGEDGTILGTIKTSGELEIATSGAKTFSGLITYVAK